jgi:hypothetical protein
MLPLSTIGWTICFSNGPASKRAAGVINFGFGVYLVDRDSTIAFGKEYAEPQQGAARPKARRPNNKGEAHVSGVWGRQMRG